MAIDLLQATGVAVAVAVLPGWFWARSLDATADIWERLALSVALSLALVPAAAIIPATALGAGVTFAVAVFCPLVVFAGGLAFYLVVGNAKGEEGPIAPPRIPAIDPVAAVMLVPAFLLALAVALGVPPIWPIWLTILLLVVFAALVHLVSRRDADVSPTPVIEEAGEPYLSGPVAVANRVALPLILLFALARGYAGPVLHDWPFIRGVDHYSHAVMANLMMQGGEISPYLIYPPGFHTMTAIVSRLSGLRPLEVFPVLAPCLLLLPVLALYSLASRLWGRTYGLAAALFAAILGGAYVYFNDAMYPNLVTSQFLLVLTVAALLRLVAAPTWRNVVLLALLGSSVVLFHQVSSLYLAILFAPVGLFALPYLLRRERATGVALFASLCLMGMLGVAYAWNTYDLGGAVGGLLDGEESATGDAVDMAIGTQMPNAFYTLLVEMVTQPVAWLGVLGLFLALEGLRAATASRTPQAFAHLLLLFWVALLFVGSRTDLSGFPRRFGRDLGVPLTLFAALALVVLLRSALGPRRAAALSLSSLLAVLTVGMVGGEVVRAGVLASGPSVQLTVTEDISEAGDWLRTHNTGGNILVSPHANQVPSRMMLAMGGYSAVQSFEQVQATHPRDLPPTGPDPVWHTLWVMNHPGGDRTAELLADYDIRYIALYKDMPDRPVREHFRRFLARPDLYRTVFENSDVLVVQPIYGPEGHPSPDEGIG